MSHRSAFSLLFFSLALALFLPSLFMDGMFMDATQYTAVGKNLSEGLGSFWRPYFTNKYYLSNTEFNFNEQTTLGFGIYAVFFKLFGDSLYVERIFVLFSYIINVYLIAKIWNLLLPNKARYALISIFLYTLFPIIFWTYQHNMLENPMTTFILASSFLGLKAIHSSSQGILYAAFSGLMLFLAFMVKGVPGLFPLSIFFLFWISRQNDFSFMRMLSYTSSALFSLSLCIGALFLFEESKASMTFYLESRLFARIGNNPTVETRFYIVSDFLQNLIVPAILMVFALVRMRLKNLKIENLKLALFLLYLGLAGILPIMLTKVQRGFYISPAYPFIALSIAIIMLPALESLRNSVSKKREALFRRIGLVLFVCVIGVTIVLAGKPKRDKDLLEDVYKIGETIGSGHIIICSVSFMKHDWAPKSYFMRYFEIEFDAQRTSFPANREQRYALFKKGEVVDEGLVPIDIELNLYELYEFRSALAPNM